MLFYLSPILYVATLVPEQYRDWYMINPLAVLLTEMRAAVVDTSAPHAWDLAGAGPLIAAGAIVVIAVVLGLYVFNRQAPRIAEEL
jgi:ABC-type polysaccharide/polyol phosphate export permease